MIPFSFTELQTHSSILWILGILVLLFLISLNKTLFKNLLFFYQKINQKDLLKYLFCIIMLVLTTLIYWEIDEHIINLPDPVVPYIFYILLVTIYFGAGFGIFTILITIFLADYYLFEPRFTFSLFHHSLDLSIMAIGLIISLYIGRKIRLYQQFMKKRTEELEILVQLRDKFSSIAAHELKTPLTALNLYSQLLNKRYDIKKDKIFRESLKSIEREINNLTRMINELLDFSRLQHDKLKIKPEFFDLTELCKKRIEVVQSLYPQHLFIFKTTLKKAVIYADWLSIDRVIMNLLTNAGRYTPNDTKILLCLKREQKNYLIMVEDKGGGIDKKHLDNLFKPFYQAENSMMGLGLGLYISKILIELHLGKIWVESKPGQGTIFYVSLPANFKKN